jgi:hypothetical protein
VNGTPIRRSGQQVESHSGPGRIVDVGTHR